MLLFVGLDLRGLHMGNILIRNGCIAAILL
jgi:hypothetical protein